MRKMKLIKLISSTLIIASVLALIPIGVSAEWKQDYTGKWYAEGNSYAIGWRKIDGNWYFFNDYGYMVKDSYADSWYLDSSGIGTECIKFEGFEIDKATGTLAKLKEIDASLSLSQPLVLPREIAGIEIKRIGENAFYRCYYLGSIVIPDSVTSIGNHAFDGCPDLTSITIPDSVTSIGSEAFVDCDSLTSITIPKNVTVINKHTFEGCHSLTNITIPDSVTSIGRNAFEYCQSLTSITIPKGVTSINDWTFYHCYNLTSATIPDSVTSINDWAFSGCNKLTSITIPDNVASIGYCAFLECNQTVFYVGSEKTKQLILDSSSNIDSNKIIIKSQTQNNSK